jgi:4-hydroxy-3-polyprenylbenzoate decarboxylase
MPIAIAIGTDPLSTIASASSVPFGEGEADLAGGLLQQPVPVVPCETVDLEVPATAEIVVEGWVDPAERRDEGPFGEYTGYAVLAESLPVVHVTAITYRNDPIFTMTCLGRPWDESDTATAVATSAIALRALRESGIDARMVFCQPPQTSFLVSARPVPGLASRVNAVFASGRYRTDVPYVVLVGDDIDVTNLEDVWWALTTRMHPRDGVRVSDHRPFNPLLPFLLPEERQRQETSSVLFDATFPTWWDARYREAHCQVVDFQRGWPEDVRQRVLDRWQEYGYPAAD